MPLCAPDHPHHGRARRYWETEVAEVVAFCRLTALALLRHLTNPRVMQHGVLDGREAWKVLEHWMALPEVRTLAEPDGVDDVLRRFCRAVNPNYALWTDVYLAAFATAGRYRLVAFDGDFHRFHGLDFLHLTVK